MTTPEISLEPDDDLKDKQVRRVRRRARLVALVNGFFFLFAGLAAIWLLWAIFKDTEHLYWLFAIYLVLLWAILAYWVLPRFHKVLTTLYVPDYFIGRARTDYGLLGDAVNIAIDGDEEPIHAVMQAAGWTLAQPVNLSSSLKIIKATLTRSSYPQAPVSTLMLFDRMQDFAYQQEVDGSPGKRHHVRFWRCPPDWPLPGGRRVGWLAAASYDKSVGLSLFTLQVTHKIGADIDVERDHVVESIGQVAPDVDVAWIKDFSTAYHARNGGGDLIRTDGNLPIIHLDDIPDSVPAPDVEQIEQNADGPDPTAADLKNEVRKIPRPPGVYYSAALLSLMIAATITSAILTLIFGRGADSVQTADVSSLFTCLGETPARILLFSIDLLVAAAIVALAVGVWNGRSGARTALILVVGLELMYVGWLWYERGLKIDFQNLPALGIAILLLIALTSTPVTEFAHSMSNWRRATRQHRREQKAQARSAKEQG